MNAPKPTSLSVKDPETGSWIFEMSDQDVVDIPFDSGEPISAVVAKLHEYWTQTQIAEPVASFTGQSVTVRVNGPTAGISRGAYYELSVTFTEAAGGEKWTKTLFIRCAS